MKKIVNSVCCLQSHPFPGVSFTGLFLGHNGPFAGNSHMVQNNILLKDRKHAGTLIQNKVNSASHALF